MHQNACSHTGSQIWGTSWKVTILFVNGEILSFGSYTFFYLSNKFRESFKDLVNISTLLHTDNSELIFFIYPNQSSFAFIMENTSSFWPLSFHSWENEIFISAHEKEMIVNELLSNFLVHS